MDFSWSQEQQTLRAQLRRLGQRLGDLGPEGEFPREDWLAPLDPASR